jgi:hypothetical protein
MVDQQELVQAPLAVDHRTEAALQVMRDEIAWFATLEETVLMRIALAASPGSLEYEYAAAELKRRGSTFSLRAI